VPVVVLATPDPPPPAALLMFGAYGIRLVVNLGERRGWEQLREIVDQTGGECGAFLTRGILEATPNASAPAREFFATLVRRAPSSPNVHVLAPFLGVHPSTLMSRFFRAGLPSPKTYLSMTRLLYAAWYLNKPRVSVAATADALHFSSPQSFGRHVRTVLGVTAGEFRRKMSAQNALEHFVTRLVVPYMDTLREFRPIG
jgi:AraC-like DNA-binding protein